MRIHTVSEELEQLKDYRHKIECGLSFLGETAVAFEELYQRIEDEGYQRPEKFSYERAIFFARRIPLFLSIYNVLMRDLKQQLENMIEAEAKTYNHLELPALSPQQKAESVEEADRDNKDKAHTRLKILFAAEMFSKLSVENQEEVIKKVKGLLASA